MGYWDLSCVSSGGPAHVYQVRACLHRTQSVVFIFWWRELEERPQGQGPALLERASSCGLFLP